MPTLRIGIMLEQCQLADIAGIDVFGNMSKVVYPDVWESELFPADLRPLLMDMEFYYISSSLEPAPMTPSIKIVPNCTYATAPRNLDIILIGGPLLSHRPEAAGVYMREAAKETKAILTTCTGGAWLASSGVLDGRKATTNREVLDYVKKIYPKVAWQDERWTIDDTAKPLLWTAGGARAGMDMVAAYAMQNFDKRIATFALTVLDVQTDGVSRYYK